MFLKLSNSELHLEMKSLAASERKIIGRVLRTINLVESRKIYLELGYSSLFEYLTKECKYSGSAAMRRIQAAKLLIEIPSLFEKIEAGSLNLSQVSDLSRAIKEKEKLGESVSLASKSNLIAAISGKTTAETQKEISLGLDIDLKIPETSTVQKDDSVHLGITFSKSQHELLSRCRDILAHQLLSDGSDVSMAAVVEALCEKFLDSKGHLEQKPASNPLKAESVVSISMGKERPLARKNISITPKMRLSVLKRDRCCQFKSPVTGKLCGSTFNLETDHIVSRWAGGGHEVDNLQVLCRAHNNYKYRRERKLSLI